MDFDFDRILRSPWLVGAAGALVTALKFTPNTPPWQKVVNVVCGAASAGFLTPMLMQYMHADSESFSNGSAFIIGLLGMSLADAVLKGIQNLDMADVIKSWFKRKE